jgi:hypothetical protein
MRNDLIYQRVADGNKSMNWIIDDLPEWHILFVKNEAK